MPNSRYDTIANSNDIGNFGNSGINEMLPNIKISKNIIKNLRKRAGISKQETISREIFENNNSPDDERIGKLAFFLNNFYLYHLDEKIPMIPILKTSDIDLPPRTKNYSELLPKHGGNVYNNQNQPNDVTRNMTQDNRHNKSQGI